VWGKDRGRRKRREHSLSRYCGQERRWNDSNNAGRFSWWGRRRVQESAKKKLKGANESEMKEKSTTTKGDSGYPTSSRKRKKKPRNDKSTPRSGKRELEHYGNLRSRTKERVSPEEKKLREETGKPKDETTPGDG